MGNIFKIIINVFLLSSLTFAQAYMDVDTNGVRITYDLSDIDSIMFNIVDDTMNVDMTSGSDIYDLADVDSITFSGDPLRKTMKVDTGNGILEYQLPDIINITYALLYYDSTGTVTDIDGNVYKTVKICNQWWMAENLKVTKYQNGDSIPDVQDNSEWMNLTTGAYCDYDLDSRNVSTYGRLYNWYAVDDSRNIAPAGWHVPSDAEWQILVECLGDSTVAGGKMKESGTMHWINPNTGATNESGFLALPAGSRSGTGLFGGKRYGAYYWCATPFSTYLAWHRSLENNYAGIYHFTYVKIDGFSVRCVRD
jgi:uncharacterized protein (TIGR02145 family)